MSDLRTGVGHSAAPDTEQAVREAVDHATRALSGQTPGLCLVSATVDHDATRVHAALRAALPGVPVHGATTCLGVLTSAGVVMGSSGGVGILLFGSPKDAAFAVGSSDFARGAFEAGKDAAKALLEHGPSGEKPSMVLIAATPGNEEQVLAGVHEVLPGVPVFGGSAADHAIVGEWSIFTTEGPRREGVTLAGLWGSSLRLGAAIEGPHEPTGKSATISASEGRTIHKLDERPATAVLHEWVGDDIADQVREGGNLLAQTGLRPVGIKRSSGDGDTFYVLLHPARAYVEGHIDLFAEAPKDATLCLMQGSTDSLVGVVDPLVDRCLAASGLSASEAKGAFLIYCAGCAGAIGGRIEEVLSRLAARLPGVPLLGFCTFGEQGHVPGAGNLHTNLSVALVVAG